MVPLPGSVGGMLSNSVISPESPHPVGYVGVGAGTNNSNGNVGQAMPIVKSQKKRKDGSAASGAGAVDYESSSSNRDDVQSPAYSDISDDSTPVAEPEIIGKSNSPLLVGQSLIQFSNRQSPGSEAPRNCKENIRRSADAAGSTRQLSHVSILWATAIFGTST